MRARWRLWRYLLARNPALRFGLGILGVLVLIAVLAPFIAPYGAHEIAPSDAFQAPTLSHPFGTDRLGGDILSRTMFAARLDLKIAVGATLFGAAIGVPIGAVFGYLGGRWDNFLMRFLEVVQSFPPLVLAMAIVAAFTQGSTVVIAVIAFISIPYYIRLVRAEVLSRRHWAFAEAAEAVGNSRLRIAFVHLLPNSLTGAVVYMSLNAGYALIVAATLGFLGLGIAPGESEWGLMVKEGSGGVIRGEWWMSFFPGLFMAAAVGSFYLIGDGLRDLLDPNLRT
jgi:peptide/nickel transport system permease protein